MEARFHIQTSFSKRKVLTKESLKFLKRDFKMEITETVK